MLGRLIKFIGSLKDSLFINQPRAPGGRKSRLTTYIHDLDPVVNHDELLAGDLIPGPPRAAIDFPPYTNHTICVKPNPNVPNQYTLSQSRLCQIDYCRCTLNNSELNTIGDAFLSFHFKDNNVSQCDTVNDPLMDWSVLVKMEFFLYEVQTMFARFYCV